MIQGTIHPVCRLAEVLTILYRRPILAGHSCVTDLPVLLASFHSLQPARLLDPRLQRQAPSGSHSVPSSVR